MTRQSLYCRIVAACSAVYRSVLYGSAQDIPPRAWVTINPWGSERQWGPIEDMGIDHGGLHVAMAQGFLDCSNIVAAFEEMCREGMPEGVARGPLGQACSGKRVSDGFLNQGFVDGASALLPCRGIDPPVFLRKDLLPAPICRRDEPLQPMPTPLLGRRAVVARPQRLTHAIEQYVLPTDRRRVWLRRI